MEENKKPEEETNSISRKKININTPVPWCWYRRINLLGVGLFLFALISSVLGKAGDVGAMLDFAITLISLVIFGMYANALYYKHINKRIIAAQHVNKNVDSVISILSKKAKPAKWVITLACTIVGIGILGILAAILIPQFEKKATAPAYTPPPNPALLNNEYKNYRNTNSVKFVVQDNCNDGISIQYRFFDLTNNLWWPSSDRVYTTSQYKIPNTHDLSCSPNAKICFGATTYTSSPTAYWGLGINKDQETYLDTSCVSCGSISEKWVNFGCPANNGYIERPQGDSKPNIKKKFESYIQVHEPSQPSNNAREAKSSNTKQDNNDISVTNNRKIIESQQLPMREPVEFSSLSPSQQASLELACFESKVKGRFFFDECIKARLANYK